jgi:hypothetical protein
VGPQERQNQVAAAYEIGLEGVRSNSMANPALSLPTDLG